MIANADGSLAPPARVAVVLADLGGLPIPALQYLILSLNKLQREVEFEFPPVEPDEPFLAGLAKGTTVNTSKFMEEAPQYLSSVHEELANYASGYALSYNKGTRIVIVSLATLDRNWYEVAQPTYSALFLGDWEGYMAPPSLLEFIVTLVAVEGLIAVLWPEARGLSHLSTRGCIGDFNATLEDVRYKILNGFLCHDCRGFMVANLPAAAVENWGAILEKRWFGSVSDPQSPAGVVAKLGYNLFVTTGLAPTRWQKLSAVLTEDGTKELLKVLAGLILAALLLLLGIKK